VRIELGIVIAVAAFVVSACGAGPEDVEQSQPDPESHAASPRTPSLEPDTGRPPVVEALPPNSFPGDDEVFLDLYGTYREITKEADRSDEAVALARRFCSIISGGGLVADKVDYWGAYSQFPDSAGALLTAAGESYCPAFFAAYTRVRGSDEPAPSTAAEKVDMTRFAFSVVGARPELNLSDAAIARQAGEVCALSPAELTAATREFIAAGDQASITRTLAFAVGFCPNRRPQLP